MGNNQCGIPIKKISYLKYLKLAICFPSPTAALRRPRSYWKHKRMQRKIGKAWPAVVLASPHFQFGLNCLWLVRSYWLWGAQRGQNGASRKRKKELATQGWPWAQYFLKCRYFLRLESVAWQWATSQ